MTSNHQPRAGMAAALAVAGGLLCQAAAAPRTELDLADLDRLLGEVKPQRGESPWREIRWLTDVTAARQQAVAEDKPLVIFTAADGSPLGRT